MKLGKATRRSEPFIFCCELSVMIISQPSSRTRVTYGSRKAVNDKAWQSEPAYRSPGIGLELRLRLVHRSE